MTVACLFGDSSSTFGLVPPGDNSLVDVRTGEAQTQEGRDEVTSDLKKQIKQISSCEPMWPSGKALGW